MVGELAAAGDADLAVGPGDRLAMQGDSWVTEVIWRHGKRNYALYLAGLMRIVCPVGDGSGTTGVGIFDADADEVDLIMRQDPGVKAGVFSYDIHPTQTFSEGRLTSSGAP